MKKKGQGMGKSAACAKTPGRDCSKHSGGVGSGVGGGGRGWIDAEGSSPLYLFFFFIMWL